MKEETKEDPRYSVESVLRPLHGTGVTQARGRGEPPLFGWSLQR